MYNGIPGVPIHLPDERPNGWNIEDEVMGA